MKDRTFYTPSHPVPRATSISREQAPIYPRGSGTQARSRRAMDDAAATSRRHQQQPASPAATTEDSRAKTAELDAPLHALGFEIDELSPSRLTGRLLVTPTCCQPFKVLHGGVSALVAEALASMGAHMASGFRHRVAGVQLSINHFRSAALGDTVVARAVPVHVGRSTQVWEVKLWKMDPSTREKAPQISESRVTLLCNLPLPEEHKNAGDALKKYSKL